MTRCCASFANCSPEPASVSITNNTYNVNGGELTFRQEAFTYDPSTDSVLPNVGGYAVHPDYDVSLSAKFYLDLERVPLSQTAVQLFFGGSVGQRPLLGYVGVSTGFDYFVVGSRVYLNMELAAGEKLFVHYAARAEAGDNDVVEVGSMSTVFATGLSADAPVEWIQKKFSSFTAVAGGTVDLGGGVSAAAQFSVDLEDPDDATVQIDSIHAFINGAAVQKPLVDYSDPSSEDYSYFSHLGKLYLNFAPLAADELFVSYVRYNGVGNPPAGDFVPTDGWVLADGETPYSQLAFADLYAWLQETGESILLDEGDDLEVGAGTVPVGGFAIRYLVPGTFAPADPGVDGSGRSATRRTIVKA